MTTLLKDLEDAKGTIPHNTEITGKHDETVEGGLYIVPVPGRPGESRVIDCNGQPFGLAATSDKDEQLQVALEELRDKDTIVQRANEFASAASAAKEEAEAAKEEAEEKAVAAELHLKNAEKQIAELQAQLKAKNKPEPPMPPSSLPPPPA